MPENNVYYQFGMRGPDYWKQYTPVTNQPLSFGFGYGLWWATQYPWARRYFPFMRWYAAQRWQPYYVVSEEDIADYKYGDRLENEVIIVDIDLFGKVPLPQLPTFASLAISLDTLTSLTKPINQLRSRDKQAIMNVVRQIQTTQDSLDTNLILRPYIMNGYLPVPDLDLQRFSWIKSATK